MSRKVKKVTYYRSDIQYFENTPEPDKFFLYRVKEYDDNGNEIRDTEYQKNGSEAAKTEQSYDSSGKIIERVTIFSDGGSERTVYLRNDFGDIIEEQQYYDDELHETLVIEYNENHKPLSRKRVDGEGELIEGEKLEYDAKGNQIRQILYDADEKPQKEVTFEYDDNNKLFKEKMVSHEDGAEEITTYVYNNEGKKVKSETVDNEGYFVGYVAVEYDEKGNPVKYLSETDSGAPSKMVNQVSYDEQGRVIDNEYYDVLRGYLVSKETANYDDEGNLKEEEIFELSLSEGKKTHYHLQLNYEYTEDSE